MTGPSLPDDELDDLLDVALEAAAAGAATALAWLYKRDALTVEQKSGPSDLVYQADRDTEETIRAVLARRRPDDAFLGEESGGQDYREGDVVWVVDPVDGTTNYLYGLDAWAVSVAAVRTGPPGRHADSPAYGEVLVGVVVEPITGRTTRARRGGGPDADAPAPCATRPTRAGRSWRSASATVRTGASPGRWSACSTRACATSGAAAAPSRPWRWSRPGRRRYRGPTVRVWDVAAGVLLVREAGGVVGDLSGPDEDGRIPRSGSLLASGPALFEPLRALIAPVYGR